MFVYPSRRFARAIALGLIPALGLALTGCSTIFRGTSQTVMLRTVPEGQSVFYRGIEFHDGDRISVHKKFEAPRFDIGGDRGRYLVDMEYSPDPWLIGDGVLGLLFLVPGIIAGGVDFGTGAWRMLEDPQIIYVPTAIAEAPEPEPATGEADGPASEPPAAGTDQDGPPPVDPPARN